MYFSQLNLSNKDKVGVKDGETQTQKGEVTCPVLPVDGQVIESEIIEFQRPCSVEHTVHRKILQMVLK